MKRPRKAVLLAAGFGTRLRPLTYETPKPLAPLWGTPLVDHVLRMLVEWGVDEVLVNLHYGARALFDHLRRRETAGLRVTLSFEPEILGTGGALQRASWFLDSAPFWMVNADIAADLNPEPLIRAFGGRGVDAVLWLHPSKGPRTVKMHRGLIHTLQGVEPGAEGMYTFCGLQLLSPRVLRYLPERGFSTIVAGYEEAMRAGRDIAGVVVPHAYWADLGTPDRYIEAHRETLAAYRQGGAGGRLVDPRMVRRAACLRRKGVAVEGFAAVSGQVEVAAGAGLRDCVLWPGAVIGPGARLSNAIVGPGARVAGRASGIVASAAFARAQPELAAVAAELGWAPEAATWTPLDVRGSARTFARMRKGRRSVIVVQYTMERPENAGYARAARFLWDNGVRVPRVLVDRPRDHVLALEDVGDDSLEAAAKRCAGAVLDRRYRRTLDNLLAMHAVSREDVAERRMRLQCRFSPSLYRWERDLFADRLLRDRLALAPRRIQQITSELEGVARKLAAVSRVLVHRDMQSSNVLFHRGRPVFIDFQGMRWGPAAYDVASLLCDPYVMLPAEQRDRLLDYYLDHCGRADEVGRSFAYAAVQRLSQALGAYGRLSAIRGAERFAACIGPAFDMMGQVLEGMDGLPALKALAGSGKEL